MSTNTTEVIDKVVVSSLIDLVNTDMQIERYLIKKIEPRNRIQTF